MIRAIIKEARPKQWLKNVLVFAAPGAAGVLSHSHELVQTLVILAAFCLASSGTYYWNDILDVEADRAHPKKCNRPIASGALPIGLARVLGTLLIIAGPALAFATRWQAGVVCVIYVVRVVHHVWIVVHCDGQAIRRAARTRRRANHSSSHARGVHARVSAHGASH